MSCQPPGLGWQASEKWWPILAPSFHSSAGGKERLFRGADPRSQPDATVLYAGGRSYADAPDKNDTIPFFYQPEFDLPLVAGCAGWLVCKVMPYRTFSSNTICLWAISSPPGAMTGYSATDIGSLMMRRTSYGPFTMSQAAVLCHRQRQQIRSWAGSGLTLPGHADR